MKIGIICAAEKELAPFFDVLREKYSLEKAMVTYRVCDFEKHEVILLFCGICKVNAAIATQALIDEFEVDYVINAGTAGGIDPEVNVFDTVISTEVAYHDVERGILTDYHPWLKSVFFKSSDELVRIAREASVKIKTPGKILFGRSVTGEAFIEDSGRQRIIDEFSPLSVDMETGSIAHVCYANEVPFVAVRSITDTAEHVGSENFEINCEAASRIAMEVTLEMLKLM